MLAAIATGLDLRFQMGDYIWPQNRPGTIRFAASGGQQLLPPNLIKSDHHVAGDPGRRSWSTFAGNQRPIRACQVAWQSRVQYEADEGGQHGDSVNTMVAPTTPVVCRGGKTRTLVARR